MAIVTRYFSTSSAGAGDGTTWANRAALFSAGNWSTVITGFNFSGSDSLQCLIGPGTYSCAQSLAAGLFANAPTEFKPLILRGCDSSGIPLAIPNRGWKSCEPEWDASGLPEIGTISNIATLDLSTTSESILLKYTASARTSGEVVTGLLQWCHVINSASNSGSRAADAFQANGCVLKCTGTAYDTIATTGSAGTHYRNCRYVGNPSASSGDRDGHTQGNNNLILSNCTIVGNPGFGIRQTGNTASYFVRLSNCVIANNGSDGWRTNNPTTPTGLQAAENCMFTGNGGYGINGLSAAIVNVVNCRFRDNTSGNITGVINRPTDIDNYTTDSDDATDYVDASGGDFTIAHDSDIAGMGFGVAEEPAPGGGGGQTSHCFIG